MIRKWPKLPSMSLMTKVPLMITLVVFASTLIIGLLVIERDWSRQRTILEAQTLTLARATAAAGKAHIVNTDVWALYRILRQLGERGTDGAGLAPVVEAAFLQPDGTTLAHTNPRAHPVGLKLASGSEAGAERLAQAIGAEAAQLLPEDVRGQGFIDAVAPITIDGVKVGLVLLRSSTAGLIAQLRTDAIVVIAFSVGLAMVMSLFGTWLSRRMVRPLQNLADGIDAVARGDLSGIRNLQRPGRDEIGQVTRQFNRMVEELAEKKQLERELAASERLAGLGRFAAGLAHEVNNPIGGMMNCVQMLSRRPDDAELVRRYVPLLDNGLRSISATIQALLGELRGDEKRTPCKVRCLTSLEEMVRSEIGDRQIRLDWVVDTADLSGLAVDCTCPHIHQIVVNLTRNAIAVMPDGGRLSFTSRKVGEELELVVADTGPGMDDETMERLFEPFYSTRPGGSGLGLWITYRIVERMGGSIRVESRPRRGTRFVVTLPLVESQARAGGEKIRAA